MASTTPVGCRLPNGIRLRVFEPGKDAFGEPMMKELGEIALAGNGQHTGRPGLSDAEDGAVFTDVDADLWAKWVKANEGNDLLTSGAVFEKGKEPKSEETEDKPLPNSGIDTGEKIDGSKAADAGEEASAESQARPADQFAARSTPRKART